METIPGPDAPDDVARSRFAHLPAGPDLDRAVAEHETRPDPTADAEALADFNERPGGRTSG